MCIRDRLDTFPKAFENYWPGLGGIDLLVGLAGAAGVYLLIQSKIRQAKKFRRDAEYGTARFGTKEDIKPFVDPKFQNNVILTGTEFLTMNTRTKIPANARNLNACVIGSSGSGKTRFWLTPQLLQAHSSYVVVDPKGGTLDPFSYTHLDVYKRQDKDKAAAPKSKAPAQKPEKTVKKEPEKKTAPTVQTAPTPKKPEKPQDAPRRGKEQIVYIKLNELHAFKNHPFEVRDDEEMRAMVSSVKDKGCLLYTSRAFRDCSISP